MKILRNYFIKEFMVPFLLSLLVLTFILILGNLVKSAELVINKGVKFTLVIKSFLYMIPFLFSYTVPLASLFGVIFALGRLSTDNEIMAIRASGINILRLIIPLLILGLILSLVLMVLNDRVIPYFHFAAKKALMEIGTRNPTAYLEPGVFINSFQKYILFIYGIEGNQLNNVRIYEPQENGPTRTIVARKGEFIYLPQEDKIKLKLIDGTSDEPNPNNPSNFYKLNFRTYFMTLNVNKQAANEPEKKPKYMSIRDLNDEINNLKKLYIDPTPLITEIHKKISMAFSCFVLILLGAPLSIFTRKHSRHINFILGFSIITFYYLLLLGAEALSVQNILPVAITMWLPNILLSSLGLYLNYRLCVS
ncbi:MAG: LptF/LptG family permease [Candidatus Omnitrophota bacterium]